MSAEKDGIRLLLFIALFFGGICWALRNLDDGRMGFGPHQRIGLALIALGYAILWLR